jgi:hypothetical protein
VALNLADNSIGDLGAAALGKALEANECLEVSLEVGGEKEVERKKGWWCWKCLGVVYFLYPEFSSYRVFHFSDFGMMGVNFLGICHPPPPWFSVLSLFFLFQPAIRSCTWIEIPSAPTEHLR